MSETIEKRHNISITISFFKMEKKNCKAGNENDIGKPAETDYMDRNRSVLIAY